MVRRRVDSWGTEADWDVSVTAAMVVLLQCMVAGMILVVCMRQRHQELGSLASASEHLQYIQTTASLTKWAFHDTIYNERTNERTNARKHARTHAHTHTRLTAPFPGLPGWAGTRKAKPIWILLQQETVSGSGIAGPYASLHLAPDR